MDNSSELAHLLEAVQRSLEAQAELKLVGVQGRVKHAEPSARQERALDPPSAARQVPAARQAPAAIAASKERPAAAAVRAIASADNAHESGPQSVPHPAPHVAPSTTVEVTAPKPAAKQPDVETLEGIQEDLGDCKRCPLCKGRTKIVFGVGGPNARLMFVGEGPGANEDRQGIPFVGRAGQLLTRMIEAMGLKREDVYIANVVKCRPPQNRDPEIDEVEACEPFLLRQIAVIQPEVIVGLGRVALQTLLRSHVSITRIRGQWHTYHGIKLMPTFHPAYLLRNPGAKKQVWDDLKSVMRELELSIPERYR